MKKELQFQLHKVSKIHNSISKPDNQILSISIFNVKDYVSIRFESTKFLRYMKQKKNQRIESDHVEQ